MRGLLRQYELVVWWATAVEMRSALERLARTRELSTQGYADAISRLQRMRRGWRESHPADRGRDQAELLLHQYTLKAADALQLAAAWVWCNGLPANRAFITGDLQLMEAARDLGFKAIQT